MIIGWGKLRVLIWSALIPACGAAQLNEAVSACPSPEVVLQRYVDAVGGKAVYDVQSRVMTARESEGDRATEHYVYKFKWKAPNKVTAGFTPYLLNLLPVSYPNGTFIFDGEAWSDVFGRTSRNEERDPAWQRTLRHKYPYNEGPNFLMFRVVADPLMMTRARELYSSFDTDSNFTDHPGLCVLRANGIDEWRYKREDILTFDAVTGFLRSWKIQTGLPPHKTYVQFQFEDYRMVGAVRFPFSVSFDFYKAIFRYTQVVNNKTLPDSDFVSKPAKP
jgi:hypothetical protein